MKAIYGKFSILCFAISFIIFICLTILDFCGYPLHYELGMQGMPIWVLLGLPPIGFVFGCLSGTKQETPKPYRYIGFYLNLVWLFYLIISSITVVR